MPKRNKQTSTGLSAKMTAIAIFLVACLWIGSGLILSPSDKSKEPIKKYRQVPPVSVKKSVAQNINQELVLYGVTKNARNIDIKPEISGKISAIKVISGADVKAGDIIFELEINEKRAEVNEAKALLKQRELEYKVAKTLTKSGHQSETKLAAAITELRIAEKILMQAKLNLDNTTIIAPFDGTVDKIQVEVGDVIDNKTVLTKLVDQSYFLAIGQVPEKMVGLIKLGTMSTVTTVSGINANGIIRYISKISDKLTRTYTVEIETPNFSYNISEGMTAQMVIPIRKVRAHLISPSNFALDEQGNIGVKTLNQKNIVDFYTIDIIKESSQGIWISGLPERASIITAGQAFLRKGDKATIAGM